MESRWSRDGVEMEARSRVRLLGRGLIHQRRPTMLSLTSCALSFSAPSTLPRGLAAAARARPVFANENEMEPDGGWGVDNLMDMMDTADEVRALIVCSGSTRHAHCTAHRSLYSCSPCRSPSVARHATTCTRHAYYAVRGRTHQPWLTIDRTPPAGRRRADRRSGVREAGVQR